MKNDKYGLIILLVILGIVAMGNSNEPSSVKRYAFIISPDRKDGLNIDYVLDTKTGRIWWHNMDVKGYSDFNPLPYRGLEGKTFLLPPEDENEVAEKTSSRTETLDPKIKEAMDKQMGLK